MQKDFSVNYSQDAEELTRKFFGRELMVDEIASVVGALDGAEIFLSAQKIGLLRTLNELMKQGGADWWKKNGYERRMIFDLTPNSSCEQTLGIYLREIDYKQE